VNQRVVSIFSQRNSGEDLAKQIAALLDQYPHQRIVSVCSPWGGSVIVVLEDKFGTVR
jgi:hypothetical protein